MHMRAPPRWTGLDVGDRLSRLWLPEEPLLTTAPIKKPASRLRPAGFRGLQRCYCAGGGEFGVAGSVTAGFDVEGALAS